MMLARSVPFELAARLRALPSPGIEDDLVIQGGCVADYRALAAHHYRDERPGAVWRIWRLVHRAPTVIGRFLGRPDATQIVGVLVLAMPVLNCRARDIATDGRYRRGSRRGAAARVNRELRTISRVIVHPQWRGLGLSVRLVRHAIASTPTPLVEARAAMGRVHPFFARAGMTPHESPPAAADARLLLALAALGIETHLLASGRAVRERLDGLGECSRRRLEQALVRWNGASCGRRRLERGPDVFDELLAAARIRMAARPVYYLARTAGFKTNAAAESGGRGGD